MFFISFSVFSQNSISGKIISRKESNPVIGASIVIARTKAVTVSDANGNFKLESTTAFPWKIKVSSIGYINYSQTITISSSVLSINLSEDEARLNEVIISASRKAEKMQDAQASVSVISAKTMKSNGSRSIIEYC